MIYLYLVKLNSSNGRAIDEFFIEETADNSEEIIHLLLVNGEQWQYHATYSFVNSNLTLSTVKSVLYCDRQRLLGYKYHMS